MTIPYHITVGHSLSSSEEENVRTIISQTFDEIDRIYNKWNPASEISAINRAKANVKLPISPELYRFLIEVDAFYTLTDKRFDPTVEPVQQLWKSALEKNRLPKQEEIDKQLASVGWSSVHFTDREIWKEQGNTSLDLGGIAKGYAIDLILQRLHEAGYENLYVEWGGEIAAKGEHPDQRPWRILVTKWGIPGDTDIVVELHNMAIASSGDYLQNWTVDGVSYSHIFNCRTGQPIKMTNRSICSVTVTASSCLIADTLATAAMLFQSREEAESWLENIKEQYPKMQYWVYMR